MAVPLTGKQKKFADEYIVCLNATEAARRAGYAGDEASLSSAGSRLLRNVKVIGYIDSQLQAHAMSSAEVLAHLTDIARGDIAYALTSLGSIDASEAVRMGKSHLIKRFKTKTVIGEESEIHEAEVEMYDRLKALETLAKYHNLTNRVIIEDWRTEAIQLIRTGQLEFKPLADEMGISLAEELFISAGIQLTDEGTASESRREE